MQAIITRTLHFSFFFSPSSTNHPLHSLLFFLYSLFFSPFPFLRSFLLPFFFSTTRQQLQGLSSSFTLFWFRFFSIMIYASLSLAMFAVSAIASPSTPATNTVSLIKRDPSGVPATRSFQNCVLKDKNFYKKKHGAMFCNKGIQMAECHVNSRWVFAYIVTAYY